MQHTATYSPEDNKLRLYPAERLDESTYARVKTAGFSWAPKQGVFVAPMWTPNRFDLLVELCGEVDDEDMTMEERAAQRAARFEEYSDKRLADAEAAAERVHELTDAVPMGQPILVGHHSQRKAEKQKEKIDSAMQKAVKMWDTSKYWEERAASALAHAKYKDKPEVRARRIKTLGAEMRKYERSKADSEKFTGLWNKEGVELTKDRALAIANHDHISACFPLDKYPRQLPVSQYEGTQSLWSALEDGIIDAEKAREIATRVHARTIERANRWIDHYKNRIAYETALLNEQGAASLIEKKPRPKQKPICNYDGQVTVKGRSFSRTPETYTMHPMTKAQYSEAVKRGNTGTWDSADGTHRVKVALIPDETKAQYLWTFAPVFITDAKITLPPVAEKEAA